MGAFVKMFTTGPMEAAIIDSVTSEASGHDVDYLLDNNPDTYWQASSDAGQEIVIDLGSAISCTKIVIWLHNYTGITNNRTVVVTGSNDKSSWSATLWSWTTSEFVSSSGPIRVKGSLSVIEEAKTAYRYYRVAIGADGVGSEVVELSGIWFCRRFQPSVANQYPERRVGSSVNRVQKSESGRTFASRINSGRSYRFERQFVVTTAADLNEIIGAHEDCGGRFLPVFLAETTVQTDTKMCHFTEDRIEDLFIAPDATYQVSVEFEIEPWIPAGRNY